jgi:hypothetical protein
MSSALEIQRKSPTPETLHAPLITVPSLGTSKDSASTVQKLLDLRQRMETPAYSRTLTRTAIGSAAKTIEELLFDKRAALKLKTAAVAMHLDREWRSSLFRELDGLLDVESWDRDDQLANDSSFFTFLRMIIFVAPARRPGLGLTYSGNMIAAWTAGRNRLTIECLPRDQVRWVLARFVDDECERAAGISPVHRIPEVLAPYTPEIWFSNGADQVTAV